MPCLMRGGAGEAFRSEGEASPPFVPCVGGSGDFERVNVILVG